METSRILVMYASEYSITDDNGRTNEGVSVHYYFYGENGEMLVNQNKESGAIGYQRAKASMDKELRKKIVAAPALYDASFNMTIGSDGKPVLRLADLQYVGNVDVALHAAKAK